MTLPDQPWNDPEKIRELYHDEGLPIREVADRLGCVCSTIYKRMERFGIESRSKSEAASSPHANFSTNSNGYEEWNLGHNGERLQLRVHRLLVIAEGESPYDVFSGEYDVHHRNDISWDNRAENVELIEADEHRNISRDKRWNGVSGDASGGDEADV